MPGPAGLNSDTCAATIVNTLTYGQNIPEDTKATMREAWEKIIGDLFIHILSNFKITVTAAPIPSMNFNLNLAGSVTIGGTEYPVNFTSASIDETTVPDPSVAIL
jgi:hypothetical protein